MKKRSMFGWLEFILGILFIILGIYTFTNPTAALGGFVIVYGIVAIVTGIADIVFYVRLEKRTGFGPVTSLVGGIISILIGILLLFNVGAGIIAISILFPFWFIIHCIARLANLGAIKLLAGKAQFYLALFVNILGLVLGLLLLFNPFASSVALSYIIAVYLLVSGVSSIVIAFSRLGDKR